MTLKKIRLVLESKSTKTNSKRLGMPLRQKSKDAKQTKNTVVMSKIKG